MSNSNSSVMYIAEVSANHLGSLERAKAIVRAAAKAGATAIKLQTYTADTMTLDLPNLKISDEHSLWGGKTLYQLYEEAHTPWDWHEELFDLAISLNLIPFSSPFDLSAVDFLEKLNAPMYKIASMETGDHRLIRAVAETGKPLIVSTGATELEEIYELVDVIKTTGNNDYTLLVCTSSYPSDPRDSHITRIETLREIFECKIGLSDHTLGIGASVAAIALGATAIEKHLTLNRSDGGADGAFSMEPQEFAALVQEGNIAKESIGQPSWLMQPSEAESRRLRRSLYIVKDVQAGEKVSYENVRAIRPGAGAPPKFLESWIGRKFRNNYIAGTPLSSERLS
ncbi:SpsE Sialic acid synthase [Candidatus Nanopelagicaceae bacterium]